MKRNINNTLTGVLIYTGIFYATSCVPARQFDEMKQTANACAEEKSKLQAQNQQLNTKFTELDSLYSSLRSDADKLRHDSTEQGSAMRRLTALYDELTKSYDKLLTNDEKLISGSQEETKKLIAQLNKAQEDLQKKEDDMRKTNQELYAQKKANELAEDSLRMREKNLDELRRVVAQRDSAVTALKNAVSKALLGFENNGLTIEQKNGMVYVSLEEQLLFASGSTVVDKKGETALKGLSDVLAKDKDINVTVEGHTDNVPISGGAIKDNWDLSVLRATEVVKIITRNKAIDPARISAAGRGPFMPVNRENTPEARTKNRRTEIILMPKISELMKVVEAQQ